jgi:hypothetical protein
MFHSAPEGPQSDPFVPNAPGIPPAPPNSILCTPNGGRPIIATSATRFVLEEDIVSTSGENAGGAQRDCSPGRPLEPQELADWRIGALTLDQRASLWKGVTELFGRSGLHMVDPIVVAQALRVFADVYVRRSEELSEAADRELEAGKGSWMLDAYLRNIKRTSPKSTVAAATAPPTTEPPAPAWTSPAAPAAPRDDTFIVDPDIKPKSLAPEQKRAKRESYCPDQGFGAFPDEIAEEGGPERSVYLMGIRWDGVTHGASQDDDRREGYFISERKAGPWRWVLWRCAWEDNYSAWVWSSAGAASWSVTDRVEAGREMIRRLWSSWGASKPAEVEDNGLIPWADVHALVEDVFGGFAGGCNEDDEEEDEEEEDET